MVSLVTHAIRFLRKAGPAWAVALAFVALLGYATFLQLEDARAASQEDLGTLKVKVEKNVMEDIRMHSIVETRLDSLIREIQGLRADFRSLMNK